MRSLITVFMMSAPCQSKSQKKYPFCSSCSKSTLIMAFAHGNHFFVTFSSDYFTYLFSKFYFPEFLGIQNPLWFTSFFFFFFRSNIYDFKISLQISYSSPLHHQFSIICRNIFPSLPYLSLKEFLHNNWEKSRNFKISFSYFYLFLSLNFFPSILVSCDGSDRGIKHSKWILNVMKKKSKIKSPWMDKIM